MTYPACFYMEKALCFDNSALRDCCIGLDGDTRGLPVIISEYGGEIPDWNRIFDIKEKRNAAVKAGNIPAICEGCGCLAEHYEFTGERKFTDIMYQTTRLCNSKCAYCSPDYYAGREYYNAYAPTKDLIQKGFFKTGGLVIFQGGEPTTMSDFDKIINLYNEQKASVRVNSSGILYKNSLFEGVKNGNLKLVVSIDSGTKELYYRIKRVDRFDNIIANFKKYASVITEANKKCLTMKYILIPGVNDSLKDVDNWLLLVRDTGVKSIILDTESGYSFKNPELQDYLYFLHDYVKHFCEENNIDFDLNIFLRWALDKRKCGEYSFENFDRQKFEILINSGRIAASDKMLSYDFS